MISKHILTRGAAITQDELDYWTVAGRVMVVAIDRVVYQRADGKLIEGYRREYKKETKSDNE